MTKRIRMALAMLLLGSMAATAQGGPHRASRSSALTAAKNLTVTVGNNVYYYLVSSNDTPTLHLSADSVKIGPDCFAKSKIKGIRFHALPRRLLCEDSITYDKAQTLDHGLLALRRNFAVNQWSSIVLPLNLTGRQVREAFGEDAMLATVRGVSENDQTAIEFQSVDLNTDEVALSANLHYLIRPTKEPDVAASNSISGFASARVKGPIYLFPNVSISANQSPRSKLYKNEDETTQVRFRGTYLTLDGSTTKNKKVQPGVITLDEASQQFQFHEDSTTVLAFRSWILDLSTEQKPLHFYVDGVELTDGIDAVTSQPTGEATGTYDLSGRRVTPRKKGLYIINGKKTVIR